MKIRFGFVSNSSSSSFIIGVKGELTKEAILEAFKIEKDSFFYKLADDISEYIKKHSKKLIKIDDYHREELQPLLDAGFELYEGRASNDSGDYLESFLCELEIDYESDDFYFKTEGNF